MTRSLPPRCTWDLDPNMEVNVQFYDEQALGVDFATSLEKVRLGMIDAIDTIYPHDLNQDENGNNDEAIAEMVKSIDNQIKEIQKKFDDFDNDD